MQRSAVRSQSLLRPSACTVLPGASAQPRAAVCTDAYRAAPAASSAHARSRLPSTRVSSLQRATTVTAAATVEAPLQPASKQQQSGPGAHCLLGHWHCAICWIALWHAEPHRDAVHGMTSMCCGLACMLMSHNCGARKPNASCSDRQQPAYTVLVGLGSRSIACKS